MRGHYCLLPNNPGDVVESEGGEHVLVEGDPAAGQGLEVDEQEQRDQQSGQGHRKPTNLHKSNNYDIKLLFLREIRLQERDLK
jgi:hypothetical protein